MTNEEISNDTYSSETPQNELLKFVKEKLNVIKENRVFVYIIRRFMVLIPLWFGTAVLTFAMVRAMGSPADLYIGTGRQRDVAVAIIEEQFGLNEPLHIQFWIWLQNFFTWEFGYSGYFKVKDPSPFINELIFQTAKLQYPALFIAISLSIPLGIIAAKNRSKLSDTLVSALALIGYSMPIYLSGYILIVVFSGGGVDIFPTGGSAIPNRPDVQWNLVFDGDENALDRLIFNIQDDLWHLVLPLVALSFFQLALYTRLIRSSMLEVLNQDYILAARANGLNERTIIWKHALRNAIIPTITFIALSLGTALGGAPITETVFSWPGLGKVYVSSIFLIDMSIILGITMIITTLILLSNLLADILYVVIDPRLSL